jgi:hypothetical protein
MRYFLMTIMFRYNVLHQKMLTKQFLLPRKPSKAENGARSVLEKEGSCFIGKLIVSFYTSYLRMLKNT